MIARLITTSFLLFFIQIQLWCQFIEVTPSVYDYGTIQQGANGTCKFTVTNSGTEPLIISRCKGSCGCLVPYCDKSPINPGLRSVIRVSYDTKRIGPINKSVTITSNAKNQSSVVVRVKGTVLAEEQSPTATEGQYAKTQQNNDASKIILSTQSNLERDVRAFVYADDGVSCSGEPIKHASLEDLVTSYFGTDLRILERRNLEVILNEQKSGMQGIFDESTIVEAGKLAGAQYVLIPKVSCLLGEDTYNLKIISCLDATTMASAHASAEDVKLRDFLGTLKVNCTPELNQEKGRQGISSTFSIGALRFLRQPKINAEHAPFSAQGEIDNGCRPPLLRGLRAAP